MSDLNEEERRAKAWLQNQGYVAARPKWLPPGRNPDFWVESATAIPPNFWAEVKSIEPDDSTAALNKYSGRVTSAAIPPGLYGHAMMELDPQVIEQSIQWALKRFVKKSKAYVGKKVSLVFLQQTQGCDQEYRVEIDSETPMVVWARASTLPLNSATMIRNDVLYAKAKVTMPDGNETVGPTYKFFGHRYPMQCALVVRLDPQGSPLEGISCMCGGSGQTRERTVRALEDANSQVKTACATRDAPGLVVLSPRGSDNDQMMQAAIYGQLTIPLHLKESQIEHGEMYHGLDGVFRRNKNTHISAAVHVRRKGAPTFFPNPFARHPIPDDAPVFAGAVRANVNFT